MEPYEIIAAPFTVWLAPVGEAFPAIDATPGGNWEKLGTSGDQDYNEEGITVSHSQTIEKFRGLGSTGPRKGFRTAEELMLRLTLHDISLEQYSQAINGNAVATTAAGSGTAGFKAMQLYMGLTVTRFALLARGNASAYGAGFNSQYQVPVCFQSGSPEPVFNKGAPAGLALEFTALEDPDAASAAARFGKLIMQHQAPLA
ncbi:MAG: hypothetical protein R3D34_06855 [Nitratireductor sp.]